MFQPLGNRSRWSVLYELLVATPTDGVLTYRQMGDALGLDPEEDRSAIQQALRSAARRHLAQDARAVEAVPNEGYRVVRAEEQIRLGQQIQTRIGNAVDRGHATVTFIDANGMTPEGQAMLEVLQQNFGMQAEFSRRMLARTARAEQAIREITQRTDTLELDTSELLQRLREHDERLRRVEEQAEDRVTA